MTITAEETTKTKLADLTVDDLLTILRAEMKDFVRDLVQEAIEEYDPDAGLEFSEETKVELAAYLREKPQGTPAKEVMKELGLLDDEDEEGELKPEVFEYLRLSPQEKGPNVSLEEIKVVLEDQCK